MALASEAAQKRCLGQRPDHLKKDVGYETKEADFIEG